jgi:hypothetical protein
MGGAMADNPAQAKPGWLRPRPVEDLFLVKNWNGQLALIFAALIVSFLLFGFWWPYWRAADMDLWMAYEGLLFNAGLPQEYFDHPGYLTILLIGNWFRLLHVAGLLDVHALTALPPPAESHAAWTAAVRAGRVLSLLLAISFVSAFGLLLRRLVGDWRIALLATFALVFSSGVVMQARIMRTELLSAGLVMLALLLLLIAAREPRNAWRVLLVGAGAFLATLGFINKVQVIFLICALPFIVIACGRVSDAGTFWRLSSRAWLLAAAAAAVALVAAYYAAPLVSFGLSGAGFQIFHWKPLPLGLSGLYQPMIAAWLLLAMLAFAAIWRVPLVETIASVGAAIGGFALALLSLRLRYHPNDVLVVMNPLEQLLSFAVTSDKGCLGLPPGGLFCSLVDGVAGVIARRSFILHTSSRPTIFLEWLVIAGAIFAWRRGEKKLAGIVALMLLVVWGIDTLGTLRGLKMEYFIYTDPLVIIAAALLFAGLPQLLQHRWFFAAGVAFIALHVVQSHVESVKFTLMQRKPLAFCAPHFHYTKRIEGYSFCPAQARDGASSSAK